MSRLMVSLVGLLLMTGCKTVDPSSSYQLTVHNAGKEPVSEVEVRYNGTVKGELEQLEGTSTSSRNLDGETMPREFTLHWKDAGGAAREKKLHHDGPFTRPFTGELYFRIEPGGEASVFRYKSRIEPRSTVGWTETKDWETNQKIPGLPRMMNEPEQ